MAKSATKSSKGKGKAKSSDKATKSKSNGQTPKQREALAKKVAKLKGQGKGWDEIIEATGVKGPATARKLLREFKLDSGVVRERQSGRKSKKGKSENDGSSKGKSKRGKSKSRAKAKGRKGKTSRNRRTKGKTNPST
jgi:hypothetical protein